MLRGKKKNVLLFWKTTSKSPKQNKQMKRNMTDCKETCWTVSFRFLTLAHHIYLDTCPLSILDTFSTHTLAARLQGSPASMPGQVCAVVSRTMWCPDAQHSVSPLRTGSVLGWLLPALLPVPGGDSQRPAALSPKQLCSHRLVA